MARHCGHDARVWIVAVFILGLFGGLLGRLCVIQGMDEPRYRALAEAQHTARVTRFERRGSIVDCRGRALAASVQVPSLFVNPTHVEDKEGQAQRLAALVGIDGKALLADMTRRREVICLKRELSAQDEKRVREHPAVRRLGDAVLVANGIVCARPCRIKDAAAAAGVLARLLGLEKDWVQLEIEDLRQFVWVKRKVTEHERQRALGEHGLEGLGVVPEYERVYPHGELAAQVVGFVGIDEQGLEGLERGMDEMMAAKPGSESYQRDAAGHHIATVEQDAEPAEKGLDIELSIDAVIQGYAQEALRRAWDLWMPKGATAVAIDPRTGDVLAAASLPGYDPNKVQEMDREDLRDAARARYLVDWMEPGSIMKPFVVSGALAEGVVSEQTVIFCENGVWLIGSRRFHDHHAYGNLTAAEVIIKSSNVGAAKIGTKLGAEKLYRCFRAFGFGRSTGFPLPGENPGRLRPPSAWTSFSLPSMSVGQEICVNALQMAMGYSAIANDGVLMKPRVIRRFRRPDGTWSERPVRAVGRAISAGIAQRMRRILCAVVEEGTGKPARLALYSMGGKTGTAQKSTKGGFSHSALICSFVGMAPVEAPRLVVMVAIDEPTRTSAGRHFGGTIAAPVVGQILKQSLAYLGVPPDKPQVLARLGFSDGREKGTR